ncbi:30S ribosomal protein S17 [Candidatus Uhrbacteria bacterium RIFCSPHIGHO2_02_FULL_60_10]|uniref:Small ribosomal subunit protein uS17 n=1 Tax=Candidatus Uhrbacteria bacterium RIFCSPHIGHO2_02_FULL_60_10 TaxID=1802392 RepID=A0A1F7U2H7_9BACT|nr:MAG: 30S ribosomal protein S17 [Candidatus Uhrbacteria bacterium RIFCSPHIGHO2_02_FULL_60_10]
MEKAQKQQRVLEGTVVSDKMMKTIVVLVEMTKTHPKYSKQYRQSRKFKVHDEARQYKVGDVVRFVETRPLSRDKRWRVIGKVA